MADLSQQITDAAGAPAEAETAAGRVKAQTLADLIAADQYLAARAAAARKGRGLRITRLVLPGQTGETTDASGAI